MAPKKSSSGVFSSSPSKNSSSSSPDEPFIYPTSYAQSEPFTRPHTVTVFLALCGAFGYALHLHHQVDVSDASSPFGNFTATSPVSTTSSTSSSSEDAMNTETPLIAADGVVPQQFTNIARGLAAAVVLGLVFCAEHLRDTLFVRPHPALWRLVTGAGLFYSMALAFALFQNLNDLRGIVRFMDPANTGKAVPDKSYGDKCEFTWENVRDSTDEFVIAHLLGWAFKAAMIRDVGISMLISGLFEIMEYTFTYIQPNFNECWWDHWILDFILCNTGGILIGHAIMEYFDSRVYNWVGVQDVPSVRGKAARILNQFTPYSWTRYEWRVFEDIRRFGYVAFMVIGIMICELDAFFLKYILLIQPRSPLNVYRLLIWFFVGMVALRDYYAFMTDPRIKRLGSTCWVILAVLVMELAVVVKFGYTLPAWQDKYPEPWIVWSWGIALTAATIALIYWFGFELPRRKRQGFAGCSRRPFKTPTSSSDNSSSTVSTIQKLIDDTHLEEEEEVDVKGNSAKKNSGKDVVVSSKSRGRAGSKSRN